MANKNPRPRSTKNLTTLDELLVAEGKRDAFEAIAIRETLAWQIENAKKTTK